MVSKNLAAELDSGGVIVRKKLRQREIYAYALPATATYLLVGPTQAVLPGVYAKYFGLELAVIAAILLYARMFDGITDFLIGYFSDRHRLNGGQRKHWVLGGGLLLLLASYFLFSPGANPLPMYFLFWMFCFYLALTLIDIPHLSWGGELSSDYEVRTRVFNTRVICMYMGYILFAVLPLLPIYTVNEYTPETLRGMFYLGSFIMVASLVVTLYYAPNGRAVATKKAISYKDMFTMVAANRPLRHFLLTALLSGIGSGMWLGLAYTFADAYLGISDHYPQVIGIALIVGFAIAPVWVKWVTRTSKVACWFISQSLYVISLLGTYFFIAPDTPWWWMLIATSVIQAGIVGIATVLPAMVGDIADFGLLKTRLDMSGSCFAAYHFVTKVSYAIGSSLSLFIAGYYGVDATSTTQSLRAIQGLEFAYLLIPAGLGVLTMGLLLLSPINRHRHAVIYARLSSLARRESAGAEGDQRETS